MKNKWMLISVFVLLTMAMLYISLINDTKAQASQSCETIIIPTVTGEVKNCLGESPIISLSSKTVTRNNYITVKIDSNSVGSPPYNWSISGTGFHFNSISGPSSEQTDRPNVELQIWADNTACGSAMITVQDECTESTSSIRQPNNGKWINYSTPCVNNVGGLTTWFYSAPIGNTRYKIHVVHNLCNTKYTKACHYGCHDHVLNNLGGYFNGSEDTIPSGLTFYCCHSGKYFCAKYPSQNYVCFYGTGSVVEQRWSCP